MNMAQINTDPMTGEEALGNDHKWTTVSSNNRYNLRPRPIKRNNKYTLLLNGQKSATVAIPKPLAHVMMTQMSV